MFVGSLCQIDFDSSFTAHVTHTHFSLYSVLHPSLCSSLWLCRFRRWWIRSCGRDTHTDKRKLRMRITTITTSECCFTVILHMISLGTPGFLIIHYVSSTQIVLIVSYFHFSWLVQLLSTNIWTLCFFQKLLNWRGNGQDTTLRTAAEFGFFKSCRAENPRKSSGFCDAWTRVSEKKKIAHCSKSVRSWISQGNT